MTERSTVAPLLAVDLLRVRESQGGQVLAGEPDLAL
jgi:hypothetical protein